jgi:hypothetical protein
MNTEMNSALMRSMIIRNTGTAKGRGVYAGRSFAAGELVEEAPVIILRTTLYIHLPIELKRLVFDWGNLSGDGDGATAIALGYGSIYNSANPANMRYEASVKHETLRFIAVRDIAEGEEFTVNYSGVNGAAESETNKWFDDLDIKPL